MRLYPGPLGCGTERSGSLVKGQAMDKATDVESFYDTITRQQFDFVLNAYEACADWTDTDMLSEDAELTGIDIIGWHDSTLATMRADLTGFLSDPGIADALQLWADTFGYEQIGHDFWLTRNGHGTGFWDRDYSGGPVTLAGRRLTDASEVYGSVDLYVGSDGWVYVS